jgi:hypothetical protein
MPIPIISASGTQYGLIVNPDGSINAATTTPLPTASPNPYYSFIYITSGTATGVTGSEIGSIIQFIGAGSYVQVLKYSNDLLIEVGSWV